MSALRLIVGLGNPGPEHARNRHNVGFWFADALAQASAVRFGREPRLNGEIARIDCEGTQLLLLKPGTYMNRSGLSVAQTLRYFRFEPEQMLVAHDDLDLPPGTARLKFDGGHGGQNGLRDIFSHLGHGRFHRLRIGIGHPGHKDRVTPWVLGNPGKDDEAALLRAVLDGLDVLPLVVRGELNEAMQRLHTQERPAS
ncbi:MAG TPA: aminoacyl-tRNA hydrolase [Xanthomonadaceae bacterium]|nr:aminoacyl-tRNA hydrolase [Xanthomonadaceae bacterium]